MKTKRFDGSDLRAVLVGMITNDQTCGRITSQWDAEGLFDAAWANLVAGWCIKHFKKYGSAPGSRIGRIYELWASQDTVDEKLSSAVESFLRAMSDEHRDEPTDFVLDIAGKYFNKVRIEREIEQARIELDAGHVDEAQKRLQGLQRVNLGLGGFLDVVKDVDAWERAFSAEAMRPLVIYNGDLGEFTKNAFLRGELYSFLAPDKTGKTTVLLDFAYRAVRQRNRVAYFDTGDSDEDEVLRRLACRSARLPETEGLLTVPAGWDDNGVIRVEVEFKAVRAYQAHSEFRKICVADDVLRVSCYRNSTLSVADLDGVLEEWGRAGWRPDVVVIDYADIMARPKGIHDPIQATDENWRLMRRLSQERHCLVATATQTKSTGYVKTDELLGPEDFSGSKGKNAHVNGTIGLNVSHADKELGLMRWNWVLRRKGYFNQKKFVWCAGCPAFGHPAMFSKLGELEDKRK